MRTVLMIVFLLNFVLGAMKGLSANISKEEAVTLIASLTLSFIGILVVAYMGEIV